MDFEQDSPKRVKAEFDDRSLNFSTSPADFDLGIVKKPKTIRDPMSHRIIEKRRRDRMNNCLADLSRLIPTNYLKQGQGRIEKTEIIEMAIKHIKTLTNLTSKQGGLKSSLPDRYLGFKECQDEVMRFLVEVEGWDAMDKLCNRLMTHLDKAGDKFRAVNDESLNKIAKEDFDNVGLTIAPKLIDPGGHVSDYCKEMSSRAGNYQDENSQNNKMEVENQPIRNSDILRPDGSKGMFMPYDNVAAQRITQEHLRRDKDLWTLLQSTYGPSLMEDSSGISVGPESCTGETRSKCNEDSIKLSDEQASVMSVSSSQACDRNENGSYKFKHNITQRFSKEEKQVQQSDTSSSSSQENDQKLKRKFRHGKCRSPSSSESSPYPNSDSSNGNSRMGCSNGNAEDYKPSLLPGFVLHPTGTHYVPLSIHPSHMESNFFNSKSAQQGPSVYHPISIPVNFGGPLLSMRKISIHSNHKSAEMIDSGLSSTSNSPSGALSSGCPSVASEL